MNILELVIREIWMDTEMWTYIEYDLEQTRGQDSRNLMTDYPEGWETLARQGLKGESLDGMRRQMFSADLRSVLGNVRSLGDWCRMMLQHWSNGIIIACLCSRYKFTCISLHVVVQSAVDIFGCFCPFLSPNPICLETLICCLAEDNIHVLCLRTLFNCCCVLSCRVVMSELFYFCHVFSPVFKAEQDGVSWLLNPSNTLSMPILHLQGSVP